MKIYTIDKDGYIVGISNLGKNYVKGSYDFEGEAPFAINHHHVTGIERPKSQEQINAERLPVLRQLISDKQLLGDDCIDEQDELRNLLGL